MKYTVNNNSITVHNTENLDLKETLECGQCFRWDEVSPNEYTGVVQNLTVTVKTNNNNFIIENTSEDDFNKIWANYFDLYTDYGSIKNKLSRIHPTLKSAAEYAPGIRILNQDPWEALCSFIISQNNNIPRIKGIIKRLCEGFGKKIKDDIYSFPSAKDLSSCTVEDLAPLRSGFRAKYIIDAAQKVASHTLDLEKIKTLPINDAREQLMTIKGVGPKVAECALLYGMHRLECFPLDVWMKRAMEKLFPGMTPEDFGENAGIAQQYIFHYSRMNPQLFQE